VRRLDDIIDFMLNMTLRVAIIALLAAVWIGLPLLALSYVFDMFTKGQ
jgi:hypothetical protein